MIKTCLNFSRIGSVIGLCGAFLGPISLQSASGSSVNLDFTSSGGTVTDTNGTGTGFTTRLSGTDSTSNDPDLLLDTTGTGTLNITAGTAGADFNGQSLVSSIEAPGVDLASLGFTGTQAFTLTAVFNAVPSGAFNNYAQIGVYVGSSSSNLTRDGFVFVDTGTAPLNGPQFYGNINTGLDSGDTFSDQHAFSAGDTFTATISRTASGVYTEMVNGINVDPAIDPNSILNLSDLTVGIYAINTDGSHPFTVGLDSFSVSVAPEPGTWAMMLGGLAMLVAFQLIRARRTQA